MLKTLKPFLQSLKIFQIRNQEKVYFFKII